MMLLALSDPVQLAIVAGIITVVPSVIGLINAWIARNAAIRVEQVKLDLIQANRRSEQGFIEVKEGVKEVLKATNGMHEKVVEAVREASFMKGAKSEADKTHEQSAAPVPTAPQVVKSATPADHEKVIKKLHVVEKKVDSVATDVGDVAAEIDKIPKEEKKP